jgi:phosphoribosylanthranilate isomerase
VSVRIKICGLTTASGVRAASLAGADALGFVFAQSVRQVSLELAAELLAAVPAGIERIAVFREPEPRLLLEVLKLPIHTVQANADWVKRTPLPDGFRVLPVVADGPDLVRRVQQAAGSIPAGRLSELGDVLVDSAAGGGSGQPADWARVASCPQIPTVVLAGGLRPLNVAHAIETAGPAAVDVSSGVESRPGLKDPERILKFVEAARAAKERR